MVTQPPGTDTEPTDETRAHPLAPEFSAVLEHGNDDFISLTRVAGLDPARDFRFTNWSGIDFSSSDLSGYDFTGANLSGCRFVGTQISGARFDMAMVDKVDLNDAADWGQFLLSWSSAERPVGDAHLPDGAVFFDNPYAPAMVVVPPGRFLMGSTKAETDRLKVDEEWAITEQPRMEVTIPRRFALARDPLSVVEYDLFKGGGTDPERSGSKADHPATDVSWHDASEFLAWLTERTAARYRLTTEAEWEYACRAGTETAYWWGDRFDKKMSNNLSDGTSKQGTYPANPFGLRDMSGNVWEWCEDVWSEDPTARPTDGSAHLPQPLPDGHTRVLRGGSWLNLPRSLRSADRSKSGPDNRDVNIGFRPARSL